MPIRKKLQPRPNPPAANIRTFLGGKVSKASAVRNDVKNGKPQDVATTISTKTPGSQKRKLDEDDGGETILPKQKKVQFAKPPAVEISNEAAAKGKIIDGSKSKKRKSRDEEESFGTPAKRLAQDQDGAEEKLPQTLQDLLSLHGHLLRALTLHYAHNGPSSPAELGMLMANTTRLWKKRTVSKSDIRRLLALYELSLESSSSSKQPQVVDLKDGKFRLYAFGSCAPNPRINLEYVGSSTMFDEQILQKAFHEHLIALYTYSGLHPHLAFLQGPLEKFPLLALITSAQEATRQTKTQQRLTSILKPAPPTQSTSSEKTSPTQNEKTASASDDLTTRKSSLLSRIQQRNHARLNTPTPTSTQILRRHALGRLEEVIHTLNMMQRLKNPGGKMKRVSFAVEQAVQTVRDSARVPIAAEEVRACLGILSEDGNGSGWCKLVKHGEVEAMVLEGQGIKGEEGRKLVERLREGEERGLDLGLRKLSVN
ncbi:MAG: hypothetical protein Q9227_005706 [Pyrenula ochraceoflavens]